MFKLALQITLLVAGFFLFPNFDVLASEGSGAEPASHVYTTWEGSEPDKGASAWLIKRFIDKDAKFILKPSGEKLTKGIAFDVPEAKFRRTHNLAGYETLLLAYKVEDPIAKKIGQIIHDIEINAWRAKVYPETIAVERLVRRIQDNYGAEMVSFNCYYDFFDVVYEQFHALRPIEEISIPSSCQGTQE